MFSVFSFSSLVLFSAPDYGIQMEVILRLAGLPLYGSILLGRRIVHQVCGSLRQGDEANYKLRHNIIKLTRRKLAG